MSDQLSFEAYVTSKGKYLSIGSDERGLEMSDALFAISLAAEAGRAILGGDVYVELDREIVPAYANWHVDRRPAEGATAFSERSARESTEYVSRYPPPDTGTSLFVLVVSP